MNATDPRLAGADARARFANWVEAIGRALQPGERYAANYAGEASDFVRMNRGKVRQAGSVAQHVLSIRLVHDARHAEHSLELTGDTRLDHQAIGAAVAALRALIRDIDADPHLMTPDRVVDSDHETGGGLPPAEAVIDQVLASAHGLDLVGFYAAGPVWRAHANSEGQRNWHAATTFNLQWSLYDRTDKAVKSSYAGFSWDHAQWDRHMTEARARLAMVARPARALAPGAYRAWLAPSAVEEIAGLLGWGAYSGRALATRQSPLTRMQDGERLSPQVTFDEDMTAGVAPAFQSDGFARPDRVALIRDGALVGSLVSPRTAREFSLATNGANAAESPESLAMAGGTLAADRALEALDTGLAIGNLWYTNYSDRPACRITGMTRFATFWVERGRIVAPVDPLRFDDTIYRMFGSNLEALSRETELRLSAESYGSRQLSGMRLPGALLRELRFTL